MEKSYADFILKKVKSDYDEIASDFSLTRNILWPELNDLVSHASEDDSVLDVGCGNGRLFELFAKRKIDYIGLDNSKKLIDLAKERYPSARFLVGDALFLPFESDSFDKVFSIAVLHHIPSIDYRLNFMKEIERVLRRDGLAIITVWNLWSWNKARKLWLNYTIKKIIGKSKLDWNDIFYPWQNKIERYIHIFSKRELVKLAELAGFNVELCVPIGKNKRNLKLILKKK